MLVGPSMKILRFTFAGAAIVWVVVLVLAPFAASRPHATTLWHAFAFAAYAVGSVICHQLPERSFHLWTAQMPVCARCTGIYFGAAIAAVATAFRTAEAVRHDTPDVGQGLSPAKIDTPDVAQGLSPAKIDIPDVAQGLSPAKIALIIAVIPTIATLAYEWTTGYTPSNWIRAAAGVPIGGVVALIIGSASAAVPARERASTTRAATKVD